MSRISPVHVRLGLNSTHQSYEDPEVRLGEGEGCLLDVCLACSS